MLRIMTLNLWGYHDWLIRQKNILDLISEVRPDFIALQEVQFDSKSYSLPQINEINKNYKYSIFAPSSLKMITGGVIVQHGLGLISKHPITNSELYLLKHHIAENDPASLLLATINYKNTTIDLCNVHFDNTDKTALLHLKETIELCKKRISNPIILGDFNLYNMPTQKSLLAEYDLSIEFDNYISFPKDNGTLDYIAIPKDAYKFKSLGTSSDYVSDHTAVWADISIN